MGGDSQVESMGDTRVCRELTWHLHVGGPGFWLRDNPPTSPALPLCLLGGGPAEETLWQLLRRGCSWARRCQSSRQRLRTPGAPGGGGGGGRGGGRRLASLVDGFGHCRLGAASQDRPGHGGRDRDVHAPVPTCHPF